MLTRVKTVQEIEDMRESGRLWGAVMSVLRQGIEAGMTTKDVADIARRELNSLGGKPAFLGYNGFPDVVCISVNEEVVHGIPGERVLSEGDLISLDYGVSYNGMITDGAITIGIGELTGAKRKLLKGTEEALMAGISVVRGGVQTGDIGAAVEKVMLKYGFGIVRDLVGHGVGHQLHEGPDIPNYGITNTGQSLSAGMTIAIEPMSTLGNEEVVLEDDGWTISTRDESLSAHFEHTILITEDAAEIITQLND